MTKVAVFPLWLLCVLPLAAADEKGNAEALAQAIAPYFDDQMIAVAHADLSRVEPDALMSRLAELAKLDAKEAAEVKSMVKDWKSWLGTFTRAGGKDMYVFVSLADLPQSPPFIIVPLTGNADAAALVKLFKEGSTQGRAGPFSVEVCEKLGNAVFVGTKETRKRLQGLKPTPRPDLAKVIAAVGDTVAQYLILPSADTRRSLQDTMPTLPKEMGGGSITVLTEGILWGAWGVDAPPKMKVRAVIQSKDDKAAQRLEEWIAGLWKIAGKEKSVRELTPNFDALAKQFTPKANGDRLTLSVDEKELVALVVSAIQKVRAAASRTVSMNNLKQLGLALHNYHDAHGHFPTAASYDKAGKPLLSWRVQILPFIEEEKLYKEFHLDEPWDSDHNKKLIPRMPKIYQGDPNLPAGQTDYLGVAGKAAMFPPGPKPITIRDVTDGTSNTIFVVEVAADRAVPWTKPVDYRYDPNAPLTGLASRENGQLFFVLMVDGSVRGLNHKINPKILKALYTRNGGEAIGEIP